MTPEQRDARAAELRHQISREWLLFAIVEVAVLWIPVAGFVLAYVLTDAISDSLLVPVVVVGTAISGALVTYWLIKRVQPLQRELRALEGRTG